MVEAGAIRHFYVILTSRCNLLCHYCFESKRRGGRMSWGTLRAALDLLIRVGEGDVSVVFYGGEPLLELPLLRRAVTYVCESAPPGMRPRFALSTNGLLLDDDVASFLARHGIDTQLSFDGVVAAQDLRGFGTFAVLDRLLDRLAAQQPRFFRDHLDLTLTLTAATLPRLADSIDYFLQKGVARVSIAPAFTDQPDWKPERITELEDQLDRTRLACLSHYRKTLKIPVELFRGKQIQARERPRTLTMCGVVRCQKLVVDVDGELYGCVTLAGSYQAPANPLLKDCMDKLRLGRLCAPDLPVRLTRFHEAAPSIRMLTDKQAKYSSYGRCDECRHLTSCVVCPIAIGHTPEPSDPDRIPDFQCAFQRTALATRERFVAERERIDEARYGKLPEAIRRVLDFAEASRG
ncbi:MAG: radical SAM protein [Acidobacteriota bacterium]